MKKLLAAGAAAAISLLVAAPAMAHVTVQPNEAQTGTFSRFVVRVPNETDGADTTKVEVQFPQNVGFVSFQPKDGWKRTVTMKTLDEPVEMFGSEVTEVIDTVTWSGGKISPSEFDEFGFSAAVPAEAGELSFPALQSYSDGEVVRWTGPEDADRPAAQVSLIDLGAEEGEGELAVLADTKDQVEALAGDGGTTAPAGDESENTGTDLGVVLGGIGIGLGAVALIVSLARRRSG